MKQSPPKMQVCLEKRGMWLERVNITLVKTAVIRKNRAISSRIICPNGNRQKENQRKNATRGKENGRDKNKTHICGAKMHPKHVQAE